MSHNHTSETWTEEDQAASEPDFYGKWMSVDKELPIKFDHIRTQTVLLWCSGQPNSPYTLGYGIMNDGVNYPFTIKRWKTTDSGSDFIHGEVTHWMKLPNPPKAD